MKREELEGKSLSELAKIYNELNPEAHLKKFASKEKGMQRILDLVGAETAELDYDEVVEESVALKEPKAPKVTKDPSAPRNTRSFSPTGAVAAMGLLYRMVTDNPDLSRQEYVDVAVTNGIKKSTAGAQWSYTKRLDQLEKDLAGRF